MNRLVLCLFHLIFSLKKNLLITACLLLASEMRQFSGLAVILMHWTIVKIQCIQNNCIDFLNNHKCAVIKLIHARLKIQMILFLFWINDFMVMK